MPAQLQLLESDGLALAGPIRYGLVKPGQDSAPVTRLLRNVGDATATGIVLGFTKVGDEDLEAWLIGEANGQTFSYTAPVSLPDLEPDGAIAITITARVPSGTVASSVVSAALLYAEWD